MLFGQETKMVTRLDKKTHYKAVYHVLKSNESILHGSYKVLGFFDVVLLEGFYKNDLKDSIWKEYQIQGGSRNLKSVGAYIKDNKVGVWEYNDVNGEPEQKYDYTKKEIIFFKPDSKVYSVVKGADTIKTKLDRPPLYIGGSTAKIESAPIKPKYPKKAIEKKISGKVYVSFIIDTTGKAINHRVISGIGYGCDEEALRIVKKIPDNWLPGLLDGKAVNVEYTLPVNFGPLK